MKSVKSDGTTDGLKPVEFDIFSYKLSNIVISTFNAPNSNSAATLLPPSSIKLSVKFFKYA